MVDAATPFAFLMLALWPAVAWVLWRRLDPARALIWTLLGAYMLLPPLVSFDLPVMPDLDKVAIPNIMAALLAVFLLRDRISFLPVAPVGKVMMAIFVLSPIATVLTNSDPVRLFQIDIPGTRIYDSVASIGNQFILLLPFFLGRRYLATPEAMRAILVALVAGGLVYSVPMIVESRLSPQLNIWVYGFFQHDFAQAIRSGGFRPFVFMPHGLWVAFFAVMCAMSAAALFRIGPAERRPMQLLIWLYLCVMVVICKSLGPLIYALTLMPLIVLLPRRWQVLVAAGLALIVMTYPLLRGAHLVPLDAILRFAESISQERAASLAFRITNEETLLARAQERLWFGWGGYGRNLIRDYFSGRILTIPDGGWIIAMGTYGWFGYLAEFGLLVLPLLLLGREVLRMPEASVSPYTACVALIYAANLVDLLPNDTLIPLTWMMAGALMGHAEALQAVRKARAGEVWARGLRDGGRRRTVI